MSFFVVVRGPLGAGKTTVARRLAENLRAKYVSIDAILDEEGVLEWDGERISERSFLKANEIAVSRVSPIMREGPPVVFDGNFYYRSSLEDLAARLPFPGRIFTLTAPLALCIERDRTRPRSYGVEATTTVYRMASSLEAGTPVDATRSVEEVVTELEAHLRVPLQGPEPARQSPPRGRDPGGAIPD